MWERFGNWAMCSSTSQKRPEVRAERIEGMTSWLSVVMSATDPEASAALIFSSFEASGTHWYEKEEAVLSFSPVSTGPAASGVVGVCTTDIHDSAESVPPSLADEVPPQEESAPAPASPAAASGRDARRFLREIKIGRAASRANGESACQGFSDD